MALSMTLQDAKDLLSSFRSNPIQNGVYVLSSPRFLHALLLVEASKRQFSLIPGTQASLSQNSLKRKRDEFESCVAEDTGPVLSRSRTPYDLPLLRDAIYAQKQSSWPKEVEDAWRQTPHTDPLWSNLPNYQTIDIALLHITQSLRLTIKAISARETQGIHIHKRGFLCPEWVFLQFIWLRLAEGEKISAPTKKGGIYRVQLTSLQRIATIFGTVWLRHKLSSGDRIFIAPRARVTKQWQCKMNWPEGITPAELLSVQKDEYVAILEDLQGTSFAYQIRSDARVSILGLDVQGKYGLLPSDALEMDTPFAIEYRPGSRSARFAMREIMRGKFGVGD